MIDEKIFPIMIEPVEFSSNYIHKRTFEIQGIPIGKGRPRVTTKGGFARAYTPRKTADYEEKVRLSYNEVWGNSCKMDTAIGADITAVFPIPKSTRKADRIRMENGNVFHTKKPDTDNVTKSVLDALNDIAYIDDSLVCDISARKFYGIDPKVIVSLINKNYNER